MHHKNIGTGVSAAVVAFSLMSLSGPAQAQTAPKAEAATDIIVTGTRQKGVSAADSAAPIQILSAQAMEKVGQPNLTQGLQQNMPSFTAQSFGGDTGNFTLSAALRGLNPNHTLILINGKRRHPSANIQVSPGAGLFQGASSPDLNLIPVSAISHVEVLKDGAAAQYGTDAIAGVINIILKNSDHGGSFTAAAGQYYKGDGETGSAQINLGTALGDRGFFNVTGEARYHGRSQVGGIDYRGLNTDGSVKSGLNPLDTAGLSGARGYPYVNLAQGDARYRLFNIMYNSRYELGDSVALYSFGSYSNRRASAYQNYRLPSAVTKVENGATIALYPNGFSPREAFYENDFSVTAGLEGEAGGWNWDLSTSYGRNQSKIWTRDSANASLYVDTGSTPTDFYDGKLTSTQWTNNLDVSKEIELGLATPVNFAFGAEYRRDTYAIAHGDAASIYKEGGQGFPGFQPSDAGKHSRSNVAAYVNLAADVVEGLHLDLAGRYEDYNDFGDALVGKLTGRYDFSPAFALRGTISTGFRAPTLGEQYYSSTTLTPNYAIVMLPVNSEAARQAGFNALKPEKSRSLSFGTVMHPAPGLQITVDAYQTTIRDRIMATGYLLGKVGPNVVSQAVLDAISGHGNVVGPNMSYVAMMLFTNAADTRTRGIDATFNYDSTLGDWGKANWSLGFNINKTKLLSQADLPSQVVSAPYGQTALLGPSAVATITESTPRWRATPAVTITHDRLSVTLRENIYGKASGLVSLTGNGVNGTVIETPVTAITDLDINYKLTNSLSINFGANNLFNKKSKTIPDIDDGAGGVRPANGGYSYNSPIIFSPYGFNGGYYYAKIAFNF